MASEKNRRSGRRGQPLRRRVAGVTPLQTVAVKPPAVRAPDLKAKTAQDKAQAEDNRPHSDLYRPGAFLDLPPEAAAYDRARVVVLPMPLEESVSYGGGTARGPEAIIAASQQVELYDSRRDAEPALTWGVHTLPPPGVLAESRKKIAAAEALAAIEAEAGKHLQAGKFVLGLGGEHTASLGLARAVAAVLGDFTLVHIDAHADLRQEYQGDPLSHACVVRRIAELPQCRRVLQLGIRSTSRDQADYCREHEERDGPRPFIRTWYAWELHRDKRWRKELRRLVKGERVFFSFDVDGLDPAVIPATGTPEPDGLTWRQLLRIADIVAGNARVVAADCVELAPASGLHYAEFAAARAAYELLIRFLEKW